MPNVFDQALAHDTVFMNKNVLSPHYIPETLPHREEQIKTIVGMLAPALRGDRVHNIFLYGKVGVGKTASVKHVLEKLTLAKEKQRAAVECIYVNCRIHNSKYQVMLKCVEHSKPNEMLLGYPFSMLFDLLLKAAANKNTIIVLDELDKVRNLDDLLYTLTRINDELESGHVSLIGITNNARFKEQLDSRSRSTLCEEEMVFPPYNADQLREILAQRVSLGYKPGTVDESAINLAAALAAQESGDARYALRLILKAGELTDTEKSNRVTDRHVKAALKSVEEDIVLELMNTLPEHQKIVLYAIATLTSEAGHYTRLDGIAEDKVLFSGEVYNRYEKLCAQFGKKPRSTRWCREYINDLETLGLVTTMISGKGVRGTTTLIRLTFEPEKIMNMVKKHFKYL